MKRLLFALSFLIFHFSFSSVAAQQRRPIDNEHPLWMIHIDVWNAADPQKIIDLVPDDIKPWVCMNLSLSCQYDKENNVYKMPRSAVRTYKSWASVCQQNNMWFTCQPASGGRTHLQVDDLGCTGGLSPCALCRHEDEETVCAVLIGQRTICISTGIKVGQTSHLLQ